jgi:prephenate dehydrogenase
MAFMKLKVTIIGLGLIGGSLGMAIRKKKLARVIGLTSDESKAAQAVKIGAVDYASTNLRGLMQDADIIFICYPIQHIISELRKIMPYVKRGAIITDVGSSKGMIVKEAEKISRKHIFFVGGHPMAGKEKTGLEHADGNLFVGNNYILTRTAKTDMKSLNLLKSFISKLGAKVQVLAPDVHDSMVAGISHMPVAVASALVDSVMSAGKGRAMAKFAASGFRDATRIASGDPDLGTGMFVTNKKAVLSSLASFKKSLSEIEKLIKRGEASEIRSKLHEVKAFRDSLYK